jgi:hypothetical protein
VGAPTNRCRGAEHKFVGAEQALVNQHEQETSREIRASTKISSKQYADVAVRAVGYLEGCFAEFSKQAGELNANNRPRRGRQGSLPAADSSGRD